MNITDKDANSVLLDLRDFPTLGKKETSFALTCLFVSINLYKSFCFTDSLLTSYNICLVPSLIDELKKISKAYSFYICKRDLTSSFGTLSSNIFDPSWNLPPRNKTGVADLAHSMYLTGSDTRTSWGGGERNILESGRKWESEFCSVALHWASGKNQHMDSILLILQLKRNEYS